MQVIDQQAEKKLNDFTDIIKPEQQQWRCIHMALSDIQLSEKLIDGVINISVGVIDNDDASLFHCHDHDIFIFGKQLNHENLEKLQRYVATLFRSDDMSSYIHLKGMDTQWSEIAYLAETKFLNYTSSDTEKTNTNKKTTNVITQEPVKAANLDAFNQARKLRKDREKLEVLIVEDDLFSRKLVTSNLQKEVSIHTAGTGLDAIQQYLLHAPDMVLLDIGLPDMSGQDVLQRICSIDKDSFIVMLSGKGDKNNVLNSIKKGAQGFVGKPFTKEKLLHYINECKQHKEEA